MDELPPYLRDPALLIAHSVVSAVVPRLVFHEFRRFYDADFPPGWDPAPLLELLESFGSDAEFRYWLLERATPREARQVVSSIDLWLQGLREAATQTQATELLRSLLQAPFAKSIAGQGLHLAKTFADIRRDQGLA